MRKSLGNPSIFKKAKRNTSGQSSSTSLSSVQQGAETRQPSVSTETSKPSEATYSTLSSLTNNSDPIASARIPRSTASPAAITSRTHDNERSKLLAETGEQSDARAASLPVQTDVNRQNEALAMSGGTSNNTISAVIPQVDATEVDNIGEKNSYGIKVLYSPSSAVIDIVFVHGLTGSAYTTWLHEESGVHWPRDLIKNDITDARIMTFGYDADVVNFWTHAAQDGISGYANDLLGSLAGHRGDINVCTSAP